MIKDEISVVSSTEREVRASEKLFYLFSGNRFVGLAQRRVVGVAGVFGILPNT